MIVAIVFMILTPIAGGLGFYITRKMIEKQLRANPPISEAQIRAMFLSMGRKPSEQQVRSVVQSMKSAKADDKYKKRK
ncbi:MAG: YneF family protein [Tenericutes bacterium]|nr:MAG: YneF family protein [Mycoplasmatota bacterium]